MDAGPQPILRPTHQPGFDRVVVNVLDLFVVFFHGAQSAVEKPSLPQFARFSARRLTKIIELVLMDFITSETVIGYTGAPMRGKWSGRKTQAAK